jgi:hypothetical protein
MADIGPDHTDDHDLIADLRSLVEAGLLEEVREPGEPSRYALTPLGRIFATARRPRAVRAPQGSGSDHVFPLTWPEPCPVCGATDGYDGGGRCLACHVPWPPEM